jgi:hypothetical protein
VEVEVIHALAHVQQRGRQLAQLPGGAVHREHLRPERVDAQLEGRDHAEVAAAAQRPEQVGVPSALARTWRSSARTTSAETRLSTVTSSRRRWWETPPLSARPATPVGNDAARSRKPKRRGDAIDVGPRGAALHVDRATGGVDADAVHRRKVDHEAAVDDGGARHVVPAAADAPWRTAGQEGDAAHHDRLPSTSRQKASTRAFHSFGTSWKG